MMRTGNPALNANVFAKSISSAGGDFATGGTMTLQGTVNKSFVLLGLLVFAASWVWGKVMAPAPILEGVGATQGIPPAVSGLMMLGVFGGMVVGFITIFKKEIARITAPIYAILQGLLAVG